jgi:uncharacterized protein (DUF1778 family)
VAAQPPRNRKPAGSAAKDRTVKTSVTVDGSLHARWSAAAALRGQDRNAFAVEAIREAVRHIVLIDRSRKPAEADDPSGEVIRPDAA